MTPDDPPPDSEAAAPVPPDAAARTLQVSDTQLRHLNRLALQARFVAGIAHELNNSLQVMSGLVELMTDRTDLPEDVAARLQRIGAQADRATEVIRHVLAYTRDQPFAMTQVDLGAAVDRSLALRRYQLGRAGIEVAWDPPASRCHIYGDDRLLQQVVLNLIVNAEEALVGQPRRHLRCALDCSSAIARFTVSDSGPGVPDDLRDRIFEPFFTTRPSDRTVGLGLTAASAIVAAHRGRLYLAGTDPGATFVVELPRGGDE